MNCFKCKKPLEEHLAIPGAPGGLECPKEELKNQCCKNCICQIECSCGSKGEHCSNPNCPCHQPEPKEKPLPCPHGRIPMGGQDGWKHCPHCLGLNASVKIEPKNQESWEKKFKELYDEDGYIEPMIIFIRNLLQETKKALKDKLIGILEEMKIKKPICYCKTNPEHNCGITSNEAIADIKKEIEKL